MEDNEFLDKLQAKIERQTDGTVDLVLDEVNAEKLEISLDGETPKVTVGSAVLEYPGFARMCIEYAVASIRRGQPIGLLEFHVLLGRN